VIVATLLVVRTAGGQPASQPASPAPVRLVVSGDAAPGLDPQRIRMRLAAEIGRPVDLTEDRDPALPEVVAESPGQPAVVTVSYRAEANELTVSYARPGGEPLSRTVRPGAGDDPAEVAVLLAGNLVRDQASELLAPVVVAVRAPAAPPADAAAVTVAAPEAPPEADGQSRLPTILRADRVEAIVWGGNLGLLNAGVRLSNPHAYAILALSGHGEDGRYMAGGGLALGTSFTWAPFAAESDIGATFMYGLDHRGYTNTRLVALVREAVACAVGAGVTVFLGVSGALITRFYSSGPDAETGVEVFGGFRL